jgi:hypothetical protein
MSNLEYPKTYTSEDIIKMSIYSPGCQIMCLNGLISKFNIRLQDYKEKIESQKELMEDYELQVKSLNICIDHLNDLIKMYSEK